MAETEKYIYGIINSNEALYFGSFGTTACEEVYTIPYQDISVVVSNSEMVDYTILPKDAVVRHLFKHQQVIEKVMEGFTVIPMRLGTFAYDEDEVRYILAKAYLMVKDIFNKISDKIEIDVVATWGDFDSVLKVIGEEKEIKGFRESLLTNPKEITVDNQMKVGAMVKNHLYKKREKYTLEIQTSLSKIIQGIKVHELMNDEMVLNTAFLINKTKQKEFDKKIEKLNTKFNNELNFRCVGPLPPYSFYTLEIKKWQFEEIDWARRKLGLQNNFATKDEIKKAHQTMAFTFHPDKNPNTSGIEREFDEITKAYKLLCEYCEGDSCSFSEEEFKKNAILVKVRD